MRPLEGSHPRMPENSRMRRIPDQNTGIEMPMSAMTMETLSASLFFFTAARTPSADADDRGDDDGADGQLGGRGEAGGDLLGDGGVGVVRLAQIALDRANQEVDVLQPDGIIQSVVGSPCSHLIGRRMLAQHDRCRVRCEYARDEKDDDGHAEKNGNHQKNSFDDVIEHKSPLLAGPVFQTGWVARCRVGLPAFRPVLRNAKRLSVKKASGEVYRNLRRFGDKTH